MKAPPPTGDAGAKTLPKAAGAKDLAEDAGAKTLPETEAQREDGLLMSGSHVAEALTQCSEAMFC